MELKVSSAAFAASGDRLKDITPARAPLCSMDRRSMADMVGATARC